MKAKFHPVGEDSFGHVATSGSTVRIYLPSEYIGDVYVSGGAIEVSLPTAEELFLVLEKIFATNRVEPCPNCTHALDATPRSDGGYTYHCETCDSLYSSEELEVLGQ